MKNSFRSLFFASLVSVMSFVNDGIANNDAVLDWVKTHDSSYTSDNYKDYFDNSDNCSEFLTYILENNMSYSVCNAFANILIDRPDVLSDVVIFEYSALAKFLTKLNPTKRLAILDSGDERRNVAVQLAAYTAGSYKPTEFANIFNTFISN